MEDSLQALSAEVPANAAPPPPRLADVISATKNDAAAATTLVLSANGVPEPPSLADAIAARGGRR